MSGYITAYVDAEVNLTIQCNNCGGELEADISGEDVNVEPCEKCCGNENLNPLKDNIYQIIAKGLSVIENSCGDILAIKSLRDDIETYRILNQ